MSAPQGRNRVWKHHKMRQSIKCIYLSSLETGDQIAVILSLISCKTTVMQFGVTDNPWEWGTDLTASNSSHLSVSSSNNLMADRSLPQACCSGHLDCYGCISGNGDKSFLQIVSIAMRWLFLSLSVHFWLNLVSSATKCCERNEAILSRKIPAGHVLISQ